MRTLLPNKVSLKTNRNQRLTPKVKNWLKRKTCQKATVLTSTTWSTEERNTKPRERTKRARRKVRKLRDLLSNQTGTETKAQTGRKTEEETKNVISFTPRQKKKGRMMKVLIWQQNSPVTRVDSDQTTQTFLERKMTEDFRPLPLLKRWQVTKWISKQMEVGSGLKLDQE